jgi:hypothetical protein
MGKSFLDVAALSDRDSGKMRRQRPIYGERRLVRHGLYLAALVTGRHSIGCSRPCIAGKSCSDRKQFSEQRNRRPRGQYRLHTRPHVWDSLSSLAPMAEPTLTQKSPRHPTGRCAERLTVHMTNFGATRTSFLPRVFADPLFR